MGAVTHLQMRSAGRPRYKRGGGLCLALCLAIACGDDLASSSGDSETTGNGTDSESAASSESSVGSTGTETTTGGESSGQTADDADILELLMAIPGVEVVERFDSDTDGRFFEITYEVATDHDDPGGGSFPLYMTLIHRDRDAPMVYFTTGYSNYFYDYEVELSRIVGGNQLSVEKRFTGISIPEADWSKLNAAQVAADGHAIVQALGTIYGAAWLRTGASLGGEDAVYHHYYYPEDFAGVVSYVSPFVLGLADERFVKHFSDAVDADCQAELEALQVVMLSDFRMDLVAELELQVSAEELTRIGSHDAALQTMVLEMPWNLWQSVGISACAGLPSADDPELGADELMTLLDDLVGGVGVVTDQALAGYQAYSYQAFTQLGRPALPLAHLAGLVDNDYVDLETGMGPEGVPLPFDPTFLPAVHDWVATQANDIIFVYGDLDPWSAGRIDASENPGVTTYHAPMGIHGTKIASLSADDEQAIEAEIAAWTGADLGLLPPLGAAPVRRVPR